MGERYDRGKQGRQETRESMLYRDRVEHGESLLTLGIDYRLLQLLSKLPGRLALDELQKPV
jgi:hypothetical protein